MKKKLSFVILGIIVLLGATAYFAIPSYVSSLVQSMLNNEGIHVEQVEFTWSGPQEIRGLQISEDELSGTFDCALQAPLMDIIKQSSSIQLLINGQLTIGTHDTLALDVDSGNVTISPSGAFSIDVHATHQDGGHLKLQATSPNCLDAQYELNENCEFTSTFELHSIPIPSVGSIGGWSVTAMNGSLSSPDLETTMNLDLHGSLQEYEADSGDVRIKLQITKSEDESSPVAIDGFEVTGMALLEQVPSSLLAPFLNTTPIDIERDIGDSFALKVTNLQQGEPLQFSFESSQCQATGLVTPSFQSLTNVELHASVNSGLIETISESRLSGDSTIHASIDECVPHGDLFSLTGQLSCSGPILITKSNVTIRDLDTTVLIQDQQQIHLEGSAKTNNKATTFTLVAKQKEKPASLIALLDEVSSSLPTGHASIDVRQFPTSILAELAGFENINTARDIGTLCDLSLTLKEEENIVAFNAKHLQLSGFVELGDSGLERLISCNLTGTIHPKLVEDIAGVKFAAPVSVAAVIDDIDMDGNSTFNGVYAIGKQQTVIRGKSARQSNDELQLHFAATGIDTHLIDAMGECNGLLVDSVGTPVSVECIIDDISGSPRVQAGGTAPNASFETQFTIAGKLANIDSQKSVASLQLTPTLTQRILKDLGPVLSDIRTVKHPIKMTVSNASVPLDGNVKKLNADVRIDIGEVELDSGAATLQLLPIFNSSHAEMIPAEFEPIEIQIRKGVITYDEFNLIIDGKYSVPYAGTINLNNRKLNLTSAVPLTGLGYSIKELRGLATDIDVPLRITGTISEPKVDVDPQFDLSKLLQSAALDAIGDAIGDALSGEGEAPDPVKLLEELLGGGQ